MKDGIHFLVNCKLFAAESMYFFTKCIHENAKSLNDAEKFIPLMSNTDNQVALCIWKFIQKLLIPVPDSLAMTANSSMCRIYLLLLTNAIALSVNIASHLITIRTLKHESCPDAGFIVAVAPRTVLMATLGPASGGEVGIATTLGLQCVMQCLTNVTF